MVENILQFATKSNKFAEAEKYPTACLMLSISHIISEFSEHGFFVEPMSLGVVYKEQFFFAHFKLINQGKDSYI